MHVTNKNTLLATLLYLRPRLKGTNRQATCTHAKGAPHDQSTESTNKQTKGHYTQTYAHESERTHALTHEDYTNQ